MTGKLTLDHTAHVEVELSESDGGHDFIIDTGSVIFCICLRTGSLPGTCHSSEPFP